MRRLGILAVLSIAALAAPSAASVHEIALGNTGEVYRVVRGQFGDLFAAPAASAKNPVMALEIARAGGGPPQRLLVPGTGGSEIESPAYLFHEERLDTVFIVWESRTNLIHSQVFLASYSYGADSWSEIIALSPESWTFKSSPQIAVSTDTYRTTDADGDSTLHRRTIVHALWWEQSGAGDRTIYSPVVLIDGAHIGWNPVQVLDELDTAEMTSNSVEPSLYRSPSLSAGSNPSTIIASFVNPKTGRLLNLEVEVLSWQLTELARGVGEKVLDLGKGSGATPKALADGARAHILVSGANWFNERFLNSLATEVASRILALGATKPGLGIRSVADAARAHILVAGVELSGPARPGRPQRSLAIGLEPEGEPLVIIQLRLTANLPVPETGSGPTSILASANGENVLVAWEDGQTIRYCEYRGGGWSAPRQIELSPQLDRERALLALQQRVHN